MKLKLTLFSILFSLSCTIIAQSIYRMNNVPIYQGTKQLKSPFTGGLNSCIVNQMDMNNDGKKDLVIVQQVGTSLGRIQTFVQQANGEHIYAPRYEAFFPKKGNYIFFLADFNEDKLEDLVVQTESYFLLHYAKRTNDSTFQFDFYDTLEYTSYDPLIGTTSISTLNKYMPVFRDLDWDGDIDIVYVTRSNYRYHYKNFKKELGLPANQNLWKGENQYYGFNTHTFDPLQIKAGVFSQMVRFTPRPTDPILEPRHDEFQMFWDLDVNNDSLYDVISYSENQRNAPLGLNIGKKDSAYLVNGDTYFPSYSKSIKTIMPIGFWLDLDNDNRRDIITSFLIERDNSGMISLADKYFNDDIAVLSQYKNIGKRTVKDAVSNTYHDSFAWITDSFIANETIDVGTCSQPCFYDYNADSLVDLLIPNLLKRDSWEVASIAYYKNIGSKQQPQYKFITNDLFGYKAKNRANIKLATADLNNDGKEDLLITSYDRVSFGAFSSNPNTTIKFELYYNNGFELFTKEDLNIYYDGNYGRSNICFYDVDKDGLNDMFVGDIYHLKYYRNRGTSTSPKFDTILCDSVINNLDIFEYSYPFHYFPAVWKNPTDNKEYLLFAYDFYGGAVGKALIDTQRLNNNRSLTIADKNIFANYSINYSPTINLKDITNDGKMELAFGNYAGGIQLFSLDSLTGTKDPPPPPSSIVGNRNDWNNIQIYPIPAHNSLTIELPIVSNATLQLYQIDGRMIQQLNIKYKEMDFDISHLNKGVYWLKIIDEKLGEKSFRIIKE